MFWWVPECPISTRMAWLVPECVPTRRAICIWRWMDTPGYLGPVFTRETIFVTSCLLSCTQVPILKTDYFKGKEFVPHRSNIFPHILGPFSYREKNRFHRLQIHFPWKWSADYFKGKEFAPHRSNIFPHILGPFSYREKNRFHRLQIHFPWKWSADYFKGKEFAPHRSNIFLHILGSFSYRDKHISQITDSLPLFWSAAEKGDLKKYANSDDPDQPAHSRSGQDLRCSPTHYMDLVEDIGLDLIAKHLTRRVPVQIGLGLAILKYVCA